MHGLKYMYFIFGLLYFVLMAMPLQAQSAQEPNPPRVLANEQKKGAQLFYLGNYEGMNGWAVVRKGKPEFFYENEDRTALVMGMLFNEEGEMLTLAQLSMLKDRIGEDAMYATTDRPRQDNQRQNLDVEEALSTVEASVDEMPQAVAQEPVQEVKSQATLNRPLTRADHMYIDLAQANWLVMNPEGRYEILAFIDPDCPHCKSLLQNQDIFSGAEGIKMHMILVGLSEDSIKRSAMLLAMADPVEALLAHANGDEQALQPPSTINTTAIESNVTLMYKYGFDVTPLIIYKTWQNQIRLVRGVPDDFGTIVNDIKNN